jgi:protoporphyrinogen oxidase
VQKQERKIYHMAKKAIIIGAGPAGLTAAYELLKHTDIKPIILEMSTDIGGIAKTSRFEGNRIDVGGHRFFSKSDRVMDWWLSFMPIQGAPSKEEHILNLSYQGKSRTLELPENGPDPETTDDVMLIRKRMTRILFLRKFFDYPVAINKNTIFNLGPVRLVKIFFTYLWIALFPIKNEESLEDFFINRFGSELYKTFFRDYTHKVWGVACKDIPASWGAQRVKGLSVYKTLVHAAKQIFQTKEDVKQKSTETSLIEQFLYPKYGPGHMWETVAKKVLEMGGEIHMQMEAVEIFDKDGVVNAISVKNHESGEVTRVEGDYFFSTMPVKHLIRGMNGSVPKEVREVSEGLIYRDFVTVGLLLDKMKLKNQTNRTTINNIIPDNWIYVQEADVKVGRFQIFNNWSPYMVKDLDKVWIGADYFCFEGDEIWNMEDDKFTEFAIDEMEKIGVLDKEDVRGSKIIRMKKTYPAYFGTYDRFHLIREYIDKIDNLYLIGRNGMHRYNNMDHSMLTAMTAVENIKNGVKDKENIWAVNTEEDYHEAKDEAEST